jgi:hypothetical protein
MDTTLHSADLTVDTLGHSQAIDQEREEAEQHIHLPNPSHWPILLSVAIAIEVTGLLFIPDNPWLSVIAAPFVLLGILGWALEDPTGRPREQTIKKRPAPPAKEILAVAHATIERVITISSTAYSVHPVTVELEEDHGPEGVVLALYGKIELMVQRQELEQALRSLPGVQHVKNFVVAEDEILLFANKRIENMQSQGRLDGAKDISILVENYILHIDGDVLNKKMKYDLELELIGIPGVRVIVNHIGLNKDIPGNLGKTANR